MATNVLSQACNRNIDYLKLYLYSTYRNLQMKISAYSYNNKNIPDAKTKGTKTKGNLNSHSLKM